MISRYSFSCPIEATGAGSHDLDVLRRLAADRSRGWGWAAGADGCPCLNSVEFRFNV
ncbi:MAG: hypothetical protein KIT69_07640 [Propionibacteriaceae bacterium]|nr:hypothetical protein [Propionibacteriaceae bacterium]